MRAEKWLNTFVRFIVLLERAGNGIGTLAFIWATVVVLGGFSTYLGADFWVATLIVFLEGFSQGQLPCYIIPFPRWMHISSYLSTALQWLEEDLCASESAGGSTSPNRLALDQSSLS
ncbi:uncharacterized protein LOC119339539 [Triticum dicoccoides]|uniref:uncharacterized protein LOC119339539 n=1 Tax=Triticum dicoccoides TaxID=85692 RepID=UPI001890C67A|nr:uncharacterized protein LOC119339539 [Triticum dicoccoides]